VDSLKEIDEYIDIYLPDCKFYSPALSNRYLGKEDYFDVAEEAMRFMAQKPLRTTPEGKMLSGLIVRHLVMPLCVSDSKAILRWFQNNVGERGYLSLMSQYTPFGDTSAFPELSRGITAREYDAVLSFASELGIRVLLAREPMDCAALGLGYIIENLDLLEHLGRTSFLKEA
jgi:putative pyruvate formate lyase activating enzyme